MYSINRQEIIRSLKKFFIEDIGGSDPATESLFSDRETAVGEFIVKSDGVVAGVNILKEGLLLGSEGMEVDIIKQEGAKVDEGNTLLTVQGPVKDLLQKERVLLNLLQRMGGIATVTKRAVDALDSQHTRICDTRKTAPGLRLFDKYAVRSGGGYNHRFGLYDGVMLKDNHIKQAGSIAAAVRDVKNKIGHMMKIEVETETQEQVEEAVRAGVDIIMFDNRSADEVTEFVKRVPESIVTEASGNITLDRLKLFSNTGVDYISLGYITHSVQALDISFNLN